MTLPYYPFYWGDYSAKTFNLTVSQHGVYMLLLRHVYCGEGRIPDERKYEIAKAFTAENRLDVDYVLAKFWLKKNGSWWNEKAEEVMKKQEDIHQTNVNKGKKGGRPAKPQLNPNLSPDEVEPKQLEPELELNIRNKVTTLPFKERRGSRISDAFEPDGSCWELSEQLNLTSQECQAALANFMDYWRAVPGAKGLKLDWQATFRNWLRNSKPKTNGKPHAAHSKPNSILSSFAGVDAFIAERERELEALERSENERAQSAFVIS